MAASEAERLRVYSNLANREKNCFGKEEGAVFKCRKRICLVGDREEEKIRYCIQSQKMGNIISERDVILSLYCEQMNEKYGDRFGLI